MMRGETYALGIAFNDESGRRTKVFHIPSRSSGNGGGNNAAAVPIPGGGGVTTTVGDYTFTEEDYKRQRTPIPDSVEDPQLDEQVTNVGANVNSITAVPTDVGDIMTDCEDCPSGGTI